MPLISRFFAFLFGLCLGSFLNVCIYRLPRELSIIKPSSFCPHCQNSIKWYDNIPLLSYFILRGKCRFCGRRISFRYFLVELISGLLLLFLYIRYLEVGLVISFFKYLFFFSLLILVSFIDIDYHAIPAYLCFLGIWGGIIFSGYETVMIIKKKGLESFDFPLIFSLKGLIFGLGFTYFFKLIGDIFINFYLTLRKKDSIEGERESLGLGDVDFMGMVGVFLGIEKVVVAFFVAPFLALFYSFFALIFKKSHLIPYLPYLSGGVFVSFLWGEKIIRLYLGG